MNLRVKQQLQELAQQERQEWGARWDQANRFAQAAHDAVVKHFGLEYGTLRYMEWVPGDELTEPIKGITDPSNAVDALTVSGTGRHTFTFALLWAVEEDEAGRVVDGVVIPWILKMGSGPLEWGLVGGVVAKRVIDFNGPLMDIDSHVAKCYQPNAPRDPNKPRLRLLKA